MVVPGHPSARKSQLRSCYAELACSPFVSFKEPAPYVDWRVLIEARRECPVVVTCPRCTETAGKDCRNSVISSNKRLKKRGEWIDDLAYAAIVEKVTAPSEA